MATVHVEDRDAVRHELDRALGGSVVFARDYRVVLPDGHIRWITAVGKVEYAENGRPSRLRGVSMDISERRKTELEIAEQRSELAHLSRVSSLGQLSGAIAHELNQPLSIILSNAQAAPRLLGVEPVDVGELREI
ncbi:MAG: PAS domain-containing protein [Verrucomicrobiales bacterium]